MAKRYPMAANFLSYKRINRDQYKVVNWLTEEEYTVGSHVAILLKNLDGKKNPYSIQCHMSRSEIKEAIAQLDEAELLRDSMTLMKEFGSYYRTVFITKWTKAKRVLAYFTNLFLLFLFVPVFIAGLFLARNIDMDCTSRTMIVGTLLGVLPGIVLHEWSHGAACVAYGGRVFEFGLMISHFIPGGYTLMDTSRIKKKFHLVQINAAGIESNILFAGLLLALSSVTPILCDELYYAGIMNISLAIVNFAFFDGLDGMNIISSLLGIEDLKSKIKMVIKCPSIRKKISNSGLEGKVAVASSYMIYLQPLLVIPTIILFEVLYL